MSTPSFERFDYLLRTNKHIERKLVFDVLLAAARRIGMPEHWYLGFGSMWFGDFRLAHRLLGIDKLVSIEFPDYADRAKFNKPFSNITVEPGDSSSVLQKLGDEAWSRPLIAWLDYDGYLNNDVVADVNLLLSRCARNSVIGITVNGARGTYRVRRPNGILARHETAVGVVENFLGAGSINTKYEPQQNQAGAYVDVGEAAFPEFLCDAISTYMTHQVLTSARQVDGQQLSYLPLFKLHHRDGADMVTVGGVVTTAADLASWQECLKGQPLLVDAAGDAAYRLLNLIPVTVKEKILLDECLPGSDDEAQFLAATKAKGLALEDAEVIKYRQFYRHFPVFVETTI